MPGRDNRLYFMVFTGKEGGSKGQAPFCAGNGDSSEDSVWNAVVYDDTLDAENAVWRRFDGALAGGSWSCLFQPFIWHSVCGNGMDEKRGLSGRGHQIAGMIAAYFISCFMLGFLTLGILKASDRGMFISDEKETYEYGGRIWEVSQDELPLKLEDLTGESYEEYTRENDKKESLLLRQESISQRPSLDAENFRELPELEYSLITVKLPVLYDRCRQALIREGECHYPEGDRIYQEEDARPWGAIEAYRIYDSRYGFRNQYLICWENVLAEIHFPWEPDEGQKGIVGKNLNKLALNS